MDDSKMDAVAVILGEREIRTWKPQPWQTKATTRVPIERKREAKQVLRALVDKEPAILREDPIGFVAVTVDFTDAGEPVESNPAADNEHRRRHTRSHWNDANYWTWALVTDKRFRLIGAGNRPRVSRIVQEDWDPDQVRGADLSVRLASVTGAKLPANADPRDAMLWTSLFLPDAPDRPRFRVTARPAAALVNTSGLAPAESLDFLDNAIRALLEISDMDAEGPRNVSLAQHTLVSDPSGNNAEHLAVAVLRGLGFGDARRTSNGDDEGVDVIGTGIVAGVRDRQGRGESREELQKLKGIACLEGHPTVAYFSKSGYTQPAISWARDAAVALFDFDGQGHPRPVNSSAWSLVLREP